MGKLRIRGGGVLHAVHLNLTAEEMVVDDLGRVVGDTHSIPCVMGEGVNGAGASGKYQHPGRGEVLVNVSLRMY